MNKLRGPTDPAETPVSPRPSRLESLRGVKVTKREKAEFSFPPEDVPPEGSTAVQQFEIKKMNDAVEEACIELAAAYDAAPTGKIVAQRAEMLKAGKKDEKYRKEKDKYMIAVADQMFTLGGGVMAISNLLRGDKACELPVWPGWAELVRVLIADGVYAADKVGDIAKELTEGFIGDNGVMLQSSDGKARYYDVLKNPPLMATVNYLAPLVSLWGGVSEQDARNWRITQGIMVIGDISRRAYKAAPKEDTVQPLAADPVTP